MNRKSIRIVGLDYHVGFLYVKDKKVFFLHSTYVTPGCVLREKASESTVLENTRYRVVGKLLGTKELVRQWLMWQDDIQPHKPVTSLAKNLFKREGLLFIKSFGLQLAFFV